MNLQQISKEAAYQTIIQRLPEEALWLNSDCLDYYAYPEVFGSTSGPFGGAGGASMTTFTIEAWVCGHTAVLFCGSKILKVTNNWKGCNTVRL